MSIYSHSNVSNWQKQLQNGFTCPDKLLSYLELSNYSQFSELAHLEFKTKVPLSFAQRMQKGNPNCPLLRQVLPVHSEMQSRDDFVIDPLFEREANPTPGILHKYKTRILLVLATQCAINCRYCFRRHFPYQDNQISPSDWESIEAYLANHKEVNEVIFSGGEPLLLPTPKLVKIANKLAQFKHIKTIRFHTRLPVVLPARIDDEFLSFLDNIPLRTVVVIHSNHPSEVNDEMASKMQQLSQHCDLLLNQSVLLKGINDDVKTLTQLSEHLFAVGVLPYYLHVLDKVKGTHHFEVPLTQAKAIFHQLQEHLPGYLVPKLVQELPGEHSKTWVNG